MQTNRCYLLDTHVWVWLLNGDLKIKQSKCFKTIISASKKSLLKLSAISIWEVCMLEAKGRLKFSTDLRVWIKDALNAPGLTVIPLLPDISVNSAYLPGTFHGDPADRIIVASARYLKASLITADKKILKYANQGHLKIIKI